MNAGRFFRTEAFEFETIRALWYAPSGGADYGEVVSAVRRIREGDLESWYEAWATLAGQRAAQADASSEQLTIGNARLRAANYMRGAEFFLSPVDRRRLESSQFAQHQFFSGLTVLGIAHERLGIPYAGVQMEAIYLPAKDADTLMVIHGGFDSTPEEMFFFLGRAAQERGVDVLIYEGPGQGNLLRRHAVPFDPAWHVPLGAALDAVPAHPGRRRIVGVGVSMGGHFLARAAAQEKRLDAIILCDYFPSPLTAFQHALPGFMRRGFAKKKPWAMWLVERQTRSDLMVGWAMANAKWTFGANTMADLVDRLTAFDEGAWVERIEADVFAMSGAEEHFFDLAAARAFVARLKKARSVTHRTFTRAEGGELHCRDGAYHLLVDSVFEWLAGHPQAPTNSRLTADSKDQRHER